MTSSLTCPAGKERNIFHHPVRIQDCGFSNTNLPPWHGPVARVAGPGLTPLFAPHPAQQEKIDHSQTFRHKAPSLAPHPVLPAGLIRDISFPCRPCLLYSLKPSQLKHRPGKSIQDGFVSLISAAGSKSLKEKCFASAAGRSDRNNEGQLSGPEAPGENLPLAEQAGGGHGDIHRGTRHPAGPAAQPLHVSPTASPLLT